MVTRTLLVICLVVANAGATWRIVNPPDNSNHPKGSNISGGGMTDAPYGTAIMAEIVINGQPENYNTGQSGTMSWSITVSPPSSPGTWTVSQNAVFLLTPYDGSNLVYSRDINIVN